MRQKFQCPECQYQASYKSHLVAPKSVHLGGKFKCPDCDYQVTQKDYLVRHKQLVHMGKLQSTHQSLGIE
jgi:ssDNA-binding Zn-finger/Zn-ribbon topoisomerase 1